MKTYFVSLFILAGSFLCTESFAQIFIKAIGSTGMGTAVGTFDGGSTRVGHQNEIEAIAYSDGLAGCSSASGPGGGGGVCKVSKSPFTFSMPLSLAVISFKYNLSIGKTITSVDMVISKNSGEVRGFEYYKVHMENVQVLSVTEGASSDDPTFNIELDPQKAAWEITKEDPNGSPGAKLSFGWDFLRNRSFNYTF